MERKQFSQRLEDVRQELGIGNWREVARKTGVSYRELMYLHHNGNRNVSLDVVRQVGMGLDRIPIAFYLADGRVEDLNEPGFLDGSEIENYVGRVFRKHRKLRNLSQRAVADGAGISVRSYINYEFGETSGQIYKIERVGERLELAPGYLVAKKKYTDADAERELEKLAGFLGRSLRDPSIDLRALKCRLDYADRISALASALRKKYHLAEPVKDHTEGGPALE